MSITLDKAALLKLSVEERFELLQLIMETLAEQGEMPPLGPDFAEIERRLEHAKSHPEELLTLEEFTEKLRTKRA